MSIASKLFSKSSITPDHEIAAALKASKSADAQCTDLDVKIAALRASLQDKQKRADELALAAMTGGPEAESAYQKANEEIEKLKTVGSKLVAAKKAASAAKLKAEQDLHRAASAGRIKTFSRLTNAREKAAQELSDVITAYRKSFAKLFEINERIASANPVAPFGPATLVGDLEVMRALAIELWRINPHYATVKNVTPLLPGASTNPLLGDAEKLPTFVSQITAANDYILAKIENGPQPSLADQLEAMREIAL